MATLAQIDGNRRNAMKSTGPKSPEGKEKVAGNSTSHGLTAARMSDDDLAVVARRKATWARDFDLGTDQKRCLFDQLVAASIQLDRIERLKPAHRAEHAASARAGWDQDRKAEAHEVAARLANDPARSAAPPGADAARRRHPRRALGKAGRGPARVGRLDRRRAVARAGPARPAGRAPPRPYAARPARGIATRSTSAARS